MRSKAALSGCQLAEGDRPITAYHQLSHFIRRMASLCTRHADMPMHDGHISAGYCLIAKGPKAAQSRPFAAQMRLPISEVICATCCALHSPQDQGERGWCTEGASTKSLARDMFCAPMGHGAASKVILHCCCSAF